MSEPIYTKTFWIIYDPDTEMFLYNNPSYTYGVTSVAILLVAFADSARIFQDEESAQVMLEKIRSEPSNALDSVISKRMVVRKVIRTDNWGN